MSIETSNVSGEGMSPTQNKEINIIVNGRPKKVP